MAPFSHLRARMRHQQFPNRFNMKHFGLLAIAVLAAACSDLGTSVSPISPPSHAVQALSAGPGKAFSVQSASWYTSHANGQYTASAVVGASGGTLSLPQADFSITFPAGAVTRDVRITIVAVPGASLAYDMFPHGLQFNKAVVVTQNLSNTAPGKGVSVSQLLYAAYLRDTREAISNQGQALAAEIIPSSTDCDPSGLPVRSTWYLKHFSRYILASGAWMVVDDAS